MRRFLLLVGPIAISFMVGCAASGHRDSAEAMGPGSDDGGSGGDGSGGATELALPSQLSPPNPCTSGAPGPRKLWRLTAAEFAASIRSIFNDTASAAPIATVFSDPSVLGFSVDANALLVQDLNASQLEDNAEAIAAWAASANELSAFASCAAQTTGAPTSTCATSFVQAFGRTAFRTTLAVSDARVAAYSKLFMAGSSNSDGAQAVISAMLQSPNFLYRSELGATASGGAFALTPYEVATELAYTLTGTTPDSALLDAADAVSAGSMTLSSMIDQQAARLLATGSPAGSVAVSGFMDGWLGLPRLYTTAHDATVFQISPAVQQDMWTETHALIMEAFNGGGTFGSVLTADHSFLNQELATYYGIPATGLGSMFTSVKYAGLTPRDPGLLATGTILNGYARPDMDSPTQRGHLVRSRLLCQSIPPPPPGVNVTFVPATMPETTRQQFIDGHEQGTVAPTASISRRSARSCRPTIRCSARRRRLGRTPRRRCSSGARAFSTPSRPRSAASRPRWAATSARSSTPTSTRSASSRTSCSRPRAAAPNRARPAATAPTSTWGTWTRWRPTWFISRSR